ncbi:MAG TPA: hypothetical protein VKV15_20920 [Bryobacteraceae bacterium]|nr:hypothetical protein [Bryobacteraceae bacterium]
MPNTQKLDARHKALTVNLAASTCGSFAEIGAGQEVARLFLVVGGASGTVAKTISAYDKEVSDDLYGSGSRYVSKQRLEAMVEKEWTDLQTQLGKTHGPQTRFFSFADTVEARNYAGTNDSHGWIGLRFQLQPGGPANDIVLHINLRDAANALQQEAIGILGVNLIFAAFYQLQTMESFLEGLAENVVRERIEVDFVDFRGPAFSGWDHQILSAHLVCAGYAEAVWFSASGEAGPPSDVLHKRPVVLAPGYFGHLDAAHAEIHSQMMAAGIQQLRGELGEAVTTPVGIFCLTAAPLGPATPNIDISDLLRRIETLLARGGDVLLFRERELYAMTGLVNRYTKAPLRFVAGLSLLIRAFIDPYGNLDGSRLEALARLFGQNARVYAYPMPAKDLQDWIDSNSVSGWEWSETNGWVSADQLRHSPPLGHLYAYLLANNFFVPMKNPARTTARPALSSTVTTSASPS